jgi:hypothetical protein
MDLIAIQYVFGQDYQAGCTTVALAQVLAFNYSKTNNKKTNVDDNCWNNVKNWNVLKNACWTDKKYDWNIIMCSNSIENLSSIGKIQLQTFLYEVSQKIGVNYDTEVTLASIENVRNAINKYNFICDQVSDYDYDKVKTSIDNGCPVIIEAMARVKKRKFLWFEILQSKEGHDWIIDGWSNFNFTATNDKTNQTMDFWGKFLHCNIGWCGDHNGYYYQGIFYMKKDTAAVEDHMVKRSSIGEEKYYNLYPKIITNIH